MSDYNMVIENCGNAGGETEYRCGLVAVQIQMVAPKSVSGPIGLE
jgi:hypothetical protein